MKILKIEFQNINSLRGTHQIDFTAAPFTSSSLFAITGPTGSGKSTILDVISLALFNHVPRLGKISRSEILNKGAILTRNQAEAFAKVTYESRSGIYTSHWSISTARTGNLREYDMVIVNEVTGAILDLKKSDVPGKNEELIGLNYNQFIKSVLLAQGEFAQFLKAKKDERGELLEKITGTGIYRQLGRKAFEKFKLVNLEIQKQQDAIAVIKQELLEDEKILDHTGNLAEKVKLCKPLEEEIKALDKNLELKKTIEAQLREIDKISTEKETSDSRLKNFDEAYGSGLKQHEKVTDFAEDLRNWSRLARDCANLDQDLGVKTEKKNINVQELTNCLKEISGFTQLEVAQEEVEIRLEEFSRKVHGLQESLKEKLSEYKSLQKHFKTETRELPCELNEQDPKATLQQLKELKMSSQIKLKELKLELREVDLEKPEAEILRIKKYLVDAREARNQVERLAGITAEIQRLESEIERLTPLLKELPGEIRHNEDQVKIFKEKLENISLKKQNQLLLANLEDHRQNLTEGQPCPLCGAVHHPYAEDLPKKNDRLDIEFLEVEHELSNWNRKLAGNLTTLKHYEKNLLEVTQKKSFQQKELKLLEGQFSEKYRHLGVEEGSDWKKICDTYDQKLEHLEQYQKITRSLECAETGVPILETMMQTSNQGKELRRNLQAVYKGEDFNSDTQRLQTRWTRLKEIEKGIGEQLEELQQKIKHSKAGLVVLENDLTGKVTKKGFESISKAGQALLPDPEYAKLRNGRDKIQKEIARNTEILNVLTAQLEKYKAGDVPSTLEELKVQQQEKSASLDQVQKECQHLRRILLNDKESRERLQKIRKEIAEKEKKIRRWDLLNKLIGDATGKRFNDFAQDLSLSHLLQLANVRLQDLSDRYRIDKPAEDEDDGLVAIDDHMGGQRRSVKTLSGGETFLLSLSMALALSDLASKNVEINSLFIDEGFGTLDPETLDQTLDTLEKLQAESSKTIGIISHVDSLKERISTQIQLSRNGQGYSSLVVKG